MNTKKTNKELMTYFLMTIIITWILWIPSILNSKEIEVPLFLLIISMMASFTPSIMGLILNRRYLGVDSFKKDMRKRLDFKFSKIWLIKIPVFFITLAGVSYKLTFLFVKDFNPVNTISWMMTPLLFIQILFIGGALGEEIGWRGFAYPRMYKIISPLLATLILGGLWSLWHLPLFFMEGTVQSNMPIWQFMLQNTLLAFFYTWLYHKTRGNLWLMIYLHAVANTTAVFFPYWQHNTGRLIGFGMLLLGCLALYILKPLQRFETRR